MSNPELCITHDREEHLDPHHFYAAYVFGSARARQDDIAAVVSNAQQLGYPVRYWWLSETMALDDAPDRLIVCAHHDSFSDAAGLDLYDVLKEQEAQWDFLEAASVGEYSVYGRPAEQGEAILMPDGTPLFPPASDESL
jgi:hypothetical protein